MTDPLCRYAGHAIDGSMDLVQEIFQDRKIGIGPNPEALTSSPP
jgi:hypothetical protein